MAKILKARYFKHTDIMNANVGSNPSYIWSRDLIDTGLCWRVGSGRQISAHKDAWIPGLLPGRSSLWTLREDDSKVADFIHRR